MVVIADQIYFFLFTLQARNIFHLFGMKYPASRMIGGSMKRKKTLGVRVEGGCSDVRKRRKPMMIPTTIKRQDSGKMW